MLFNLLTLYSDIEFTQLSESGGYAPFTLCADAEVEEACAHSILFAELNHRLDVTLGAEAEIGVD